MRKVILSLLVFTAFTSVNAVETYSFHHIVEPGDLAQQLADGAIGETQLFVDVEGIGGNQVPFTFRNIGPEPSIITGVYFDDGTTLLSVASLIDADDGIGGDPDVDFSIGANPSILPGGDNLSPNFITTPGFLADADPPPGTNGNGIDPSESLGMIFNLQTGKTLDDTIIALNNSDLRIGIKVQGFASGGSEAFVTFIPAPGAVVLSSIGISILALLRKRKKL